MFRLLFYLFCILKGSQINCIGGDHLNNRIMCPINNGKIWNIEVTRRFIRTFYDFSARQLEYQDLNFKMRVCDLEMSFVVDDAEYTKSFRLERLKKANSNEFFFVEYMQVRVYSKFNLILP